MDEPIIRVEHLSKTFKPTTTFRISDLVNFRVKRKKGFVALDDINFTVRRGEFFGVIGRNGSGKSTLLRILLGSLPPDNKKSVTIKGEAMRLALGIGFNNDLTARDNIYINSSLLGLSFKEIGEQFDKILAYAEVEEFVDTQIKHFSSGMKSRLSFAIAMRAKSDILLLDEFFGGVGDEGFRKKSQQSFKDLLKQGKTIIFVSHNLKVIAQNCDRVLLLNKGKQVGLGPAEEIIPIYQQFFKQKKKQKNESKATEQN